MGSLNLLDNLVASPNYGLVSRESELTVVEGSAQAWAYAASAELEGRGAAAVKAQMKLTRGSMSIGVLSKNKTSFVIERTIPLTRGFVVFELPIPDIEACGEIVFRTYNDGAVKPMLEVRSLVLEPQRAPASAEVSVEPAVDPLVENLWPLIEFFNIPAMRRWSRAELDFYLSGDSWRDNIILNKWEFATGAARLESYPWRFSVPFVLCNARCEFCSAWLVQGEPMPIDLFDRLDVMLPYLAQIDMVGWGEPLIHPEFGQVLDKLKSRADSRARISLTTNGLHLGKWVRHLAEANVRDFAISIHAARPETHEDLMGLPRGSFEKVLEGVRTLVAAREAGRHLIVSFVFIVTRQNLAEVPEFIQLAERLGVDRVFIRTLKARTPEEQRNNGLDYHRLPPYLHPDFEPLRARAIEAIAGTRLEVEAFPESWSTPIFPPEHEPQILMAPLTPREVRMKSKSYHQKPLPDTEDLPVGEALEDSRPELHEQMENPYNRTAPMWCPSPYTAFYINGFDRQVNPCCYMTSIPGHRESYLRKGASFDDVWNSPAMIALRRSLNEGPLKQPCLKCAFYW
jgi:pyruvate-formate lyase-activating enzyme